MRIFGYNVKLNFKFWKTRKGTAATPMIGVQITKAAPSNDDHYRAELSKIGDHPITFHGKCSYFGGPKDTGVSATEKLAFFEAMDQVRAKKLGLEKYFLKAHDDNLARNLNPDTFYIACRWDYQTTSRHYLLSHKVLVRNPENGQWCLCQPIDWGPHQRTGRSCDLSPGALRYLSAATDDYLLVFLERPAD